MSNNNNRIEDYFTLFVVPLCYDTSNPIGSHTGIVQYSTIHRVRAHR